MDAIQLNNHGKLIYSPMQEIVMINNATIINSPGGKFIVQRNYERKKQFGSKLINYPINMRIILQVI